MNRDTTRRTVTYHDTFDGTPKPTFLAERLENLSLVFATSPDDGVTVLFGTSLSVLSLDSPIRRSHSCVIAGVVAYSRDVGACCDGAGKG